MLPFSPPSNCRRWFGVVLLAASIGALSAWGSLAAADEIEELRAGIPTGVAVREEIARLSDTRDGLLASLNAADHGLAGIQQLAGDATLLFYMTEEAQEGRDAYQEKRRPEFEKFPKRP